jgi:hypothetical protein
MNKPEACELNLNAGDILTIEGYMSNGFAGLSTWQWFGADGKGIAPGYASIVERGYIKLMKVA